MTRSYAGVSFRLTVENLRPFYPDHACCARRRAARALRRAPDPALEARPRARSRRLVAPGRLPRRRRDARGVDPPPPRREGRRAGALPPGAARHVERSPAPPRPAPARDRLPRPRPHRRRPVGAGRHHVASRRPPPANGVRPRRDRPRRPGAAPGEAVLHEPRLRACPADVHDLGAAGVVHRLAGPRGIRDEPPARARPARIARRHRRATAARPGRRPAGDRLPLPLAGAGGYRPVRGAPTAYPFRVKRFVLVALVLAALAPAAAAKQQQEQRPWLWQCDRIGRLDAQWQCYVRMLLQDIDASADPATELPRIDRRARAAGTSLEGMCHALMHEVGRRYGAEHHVMLGRLMDYIPRSNDPTCSAGFGMGLVMYLGPQIIRSGGRSALVQCTKLPTHFR